MKHAVPTLAALCLAAALIAESRAVAEEAAFKNLEEKASYAIGLNFGKQLQRGGSGVVLEKLFQGIKDGHTNAKALMTDEEMDNALRAFQELVMKGAAMENAQAGSAFLEANGKKEGVVTTKSGLQYLVLKAGEGPKPTAADTVTTHYRGTLIDGTEFDSSYKRGKPATFALNGVIPGWTEGLQLMPVGSKYRFFIPSRLAYGEHATGPHIGPNSTLIFEVELVEIKGAE